MLSILDRIGKLSEIVHLCGASGGFGTFKGHLIMKIMCLSIHISQFGKITIIISRKVSLYALFEFLIFTPEGPGRGFSEG